MRRAAGVGSLLSLAVAALALVGLGCAARKPTALGSASPGPGPRLSLDEAAERYVKLALALGEHDPVYVDAFYGPPGWREEARRERLSLEAIGERARGLRDALRPAPAPGRDALRSAPAPGRDALRSAPAPGGDEAVALRRDYLAGQIAALSARVEMLRGKKLSFDEESGALYDAVAPRHPESYFQGLTAELDRELPGGGPLIERLEAFRAEFVIPKERLDAVFKAAVEGCRSRTLAQVALPPGESFTIEYVTGKPWGGYNWYKGDFRSVIQVNTDLPTFIDRAVDLACHEGYPGHHVANVLLERDLVRGRGWVEFQLAVLFGPQALVAEGSANYGIEVAFPARERAEFERSTLFPLAGLDPARAERYHRVRKLAAKLDYAVNEAARDYLDGAIGADRATGWLTAYALLSPPRARQRLTFIEQYRSYVINYNLGNDLVKRYVESRAGGDRGRRWQAFAGLLSMPRRPSALN